VERPGRSYEESCALLDRIVGRCVRDAEFSERVLNEPDDALREYGLTEDELDDFQILGADHNSEAEKVWQSIRTRMEELRSRRGQVVQR
jgi:hypothetical protein